VVADDFLLELRLLFCSIDNIAIHKNFSFSLPRNSRWSPPCLPLLAATQSFHAIGGLGFFNRNTPTSVVFIDVFAFPIRNITMILKRRDKATCEAIPSARAIAHLVCGELSDCDPPSTKRQTPCASASRISEATLISHRRISRPRHNRPLVSARSAM
jgi:hypothetical protein